MTVPSSGEQICTARDVTVQKLQAQAHAESEERFRVLATQAPVGIFQDNSEGSCSFVNQHWSNLTGLSGEESLGYGWVQAIHPEDLPRVMAKWKACVTNQQEFADEYRLVRKNGDVRSVIAAARATKDSQGNSVNYIGTLLDITSELGDTIHLNDKFFSDSSVQQFGIPCVVCHGVTGTGIVRSPNSFRLSNGGELSLQQLTSTRDLVANSARAVGEVATFIYVA